MVADVFFHDVIVKYLQILVQRLFLVNIQLQFSAHYIAHFLLIAIYQFLYLFQFFGQQHFFGIVLVFAILLA
jgi:hypothetical protein